MLVLQTVHKKDDAKGRSKKRGKDGGKSTTSEPSKVLDLDTRIEMLLRGKAGPTPPFLQLGICSEDEEDRTRKTSRSSPEKSQ